MKSLKKSLCTVLAVLLFICGIGFCRQPVCAGDKFTVNMSEHLEMWHYSGGYWIVGNSNETTTRYTDYQIDSAGYDQITNKYRVHMEADVPVSVSSLMADGKEINIKAENIKEGITILGVEGTLEEQREDDYYDTCEQIASMILNETPVIDDPYISFGDVILDTAKLPSVDVTGSTLSLENTKAVELEYLTCDGDEYIDTGIIPTATWVEMGVHINSLDSTRNIALFGVTNTTYHCCITPDNMLQYACGNASHLTTIDCSVLGTTGIHTVSFND